MDFYNLSSAPASRKSMQALTKTGVHNSSIKLQDCTVYSRVGFRGLGAESFLTANGFPIPTQPNQSLLYKEDIVVLRLSKLEFWVVDTTNTHHELIEMLEVASKNLANVYRLYCQHSHAFFLLTGEETASMFSKLCSVDLRSYVFPSGSIAQTSVARTNAIVARQSKGGKEYILLMSDLASAQYLWEAVVDACAEYI